jgi:hypothetical protein
VPFALPVLVRASLSPASDKDQSARERKKKRLWGMYYVADFSKESRVSGTEQAGGWNYEARDEGQHLQVPMQASEVVDALGPSLKAEARKKLDELVRSALSKAIRNAETGVTRPSYGRYAWNEPMNGVANTPFGPVTDKEGGA